MQFLIVLLHKGIKRLSDLDRGRFFLGLLNWNSAGKKFPFWFCLNKDRSCTHGRLIFTVDVFLAGLLEVSELLWRLSTCSTDVSLFLIFSLWAGSLVWISRTNAGEPQPRAGEKNGARKTQMNGDSTRNKKLQLHYELAVRSTVQFTLQEFFSVLLLCRIVLSSHPPW